MSDAIGALYLHIPFCKRKCLYCDFPSSATNAANPAMKLHCQKLAHQIEEVAEKGMLKECKTAYLGGGTPTFLGPELLEGLVSRVRMACPALEELTFEANPDSLSDDVLKRCVNAGATRVSIGVQSVVDAELHALGRIHTASQAIRRVEAAVASGLDVSVDLMCAIPEQTDASWEATIRTVLGLGVQHVSVYPLAIEEDTPFGRAFGNEPAPFNDEDVQAHRMEVACSLLESAGYSRYEVASYALPGKQCAHNTAYWTGVPYLGFGAGAASMLTRRGYERLRAIWEELPPVQGNAARIRFLLPDLNVEWMGEREAWAEDLMLGMRLVRGVELELVPAKTVTELTKRGLVRVQDGRMVPTHDGWLLGNELYGALWDLADADE